MLASCDGTGDRLESRACKAFFEARYGINMSFRASSTHVVDTPISFKSLKDKYYPGQRTEVERLHLLLAQRRKLSVRSLGMNADQPELVNGVKLNGIVCDFLVTDGELYRADTIIEDAKAKASMAEVGDLADSLASNELKALVPKGSPNSQCCMP